MSKIDVTVVLNMHREALFLRPILISLDTCASCEAQKAGLIVERHGDSNFRRRVAEVFRLVTQCKEAVL